MRDHVIGIDIGTTGTKTGIYDKNGRLVGDAFEESILRYPRPGEVELAMPWRDEAGQYSGFLHAGVVGALIDAACGFAAVSLAGARVMASHFAVNCLRPAVGERFVAKARVLRAGRQQVFTRCELYAHDRGRDTLVATGETRLCVVGDDTPA